MFAIRTKVKLAAGIAAGALTLGAAGAYAAANANSTVAVTPGGAVNVSGASTLTPAPALTSLDGSTIQLTADFKNPGKCVSTFAKNKNILLAPAAGTTRVAKNYHGKLMSTIQSWCQQFKSTTTNSSAETETPEATQSDAPSTDSQSGGSHGHGHANGHSQPTS